MSSQWNSVHILPHLLAHEVQLWRIDLGDTFDSAYYASLLTPSELADANRRRAGEVRDHFTIGRACLRVLLGNAVGIDIRDITITKGAHGKPSIPTTGDTRISFNIAHSKNTLLIAIGRQEAIGVDVEYIDRSVDLMEVAQANFTEDEIARLLSIRDKDEQQKTFYTYWVRKEAIAKADGRGLLLAMNSFDVSADSMNHHRVEVKEPGRSQSYFVSDLELGDEIAGALALTSPECKLHQLIFPLDSPPIPLL
jgi:4'-phosphopantetheinyl transferase